MSSSFCMDEKRTLWPWTLYIGHDQRTCYHAKSVKGDRVGVEILRSMSKIRPEPLHTISATYNSARAKDRAQRRLLPLVAIGGQGGHPLRTF